GRVVLVNGMEAWIDGPGGSFALTSHRYAPGVVYPDGAMRLTAFTDEPWPCWRFALPDGTRVEQEVFVPPGGPVVVAWRLLESTSGVRLRVRLLLSGRDYHALHHENPAFRFDADVGPGRVAWHPYAGLPAIVARTNGTYVHQPDWYRRFLYAEEQARGLDCVEDLASPGIFHWDLGGGEATMVLTTAPDEATPSVAELRAAERTRRLAFASRLHRAADAYLARRGTGKTIVAGYPWFTDWGRDTFIALRGLCLATDRLDDARDILLEWAGTISQGMLPNRFPDRGAQPEYNSVDAALWFVVAVHELLQRNHGLAAADRVALRTAVEAILDGYARGTRHGIRMDADGLLAAGEPGMQLTWMDARVGDWVVTPRIGKPVEVQALWVNALRIGAAIAPRWAPLAARAAAAFDARCWHDAGGHLYDVVDVDHRPGAVDPTFRPNQILAVGGLPFVLLTGERARRVVSAVERRLWTTIGLRTLPPDAPGYHGRYEGGVADRDGAYHQGTAWPWLLGPFVEAWVRVFGNVPE